MSQQVMVGKSIHPLDSCGDTFTVMETYLYILYLYCTYIRIYIYIYVACLSHIRSCFTLECCKYVQFFHTYLQVGLLHTLQQGSCVWLPFNREGYSALQGTPWQSSYKWPTCRSWAMWTMQLARFVPCLLNSQGANVRAVPLCFTNLGCVSLFMKSLRCCMARSIIP